jgi:hypothetical protein
LERHVSSIRPLAKIKLLISYRRKTRRRAVRVCFIHKLPDEVLDQIFLLVDGYNGDMLQSLILPNKREMNSNTYAWPALLPIYATCRRWYTILGGRQHHRFRLLSYGLKVVNRNTENPEHETHDELAEWSSLLETEGLKRMRLFVAMCLGGAGGGQEGQDIGALLADKLLDHSESLRALFVQNTDGELFPMDSFFTRLSSRQNAAVNIEELHISSALPLYGRPETDKVPLTLTRLTSLTLNSTEKAFIPFGPVLGSAFPSLVRLSLSRIEQLERAEPSLSEVFSTLYSVNTLRSLELESTTTFDDFDPPPFAGYIKSKLTHLKICAHLGIIRSLFGWVRYPYLERLEVSAPKGARVTHLPPEGMDDHLIIWLLEWSVQEAGSPAKEFPRLTYLDLSNCGPILLIYFVFFARMEKLKVLNLRKIALVDGGRPRINVDVVNWSKIHKYGSYGFNRPKELEELTLYFFPHELVATFLAHIPLGNLKSLNIINENYSSARGSLAGHTQEVVHVDGCLDGLTRLVKIEIRAAWNQVEEFLDLLPDCLENLEVFGLQVLDEGMASCQSFIPSNPSRHPIDAPKLRSIDLPDYETISAVVLKRFKMTPPVKNMKIDIFRNRESYGPQLENRKVWLRILEVYPDLFASVAQLDLRIPKEAFYDPKEKSPVDFPLLTAFPNVSILTLRMCEAKPEWLAFILRKGHDARGRKYQPIQSRRLKRLNLHIHLSNQWAAGIDRVIKGYAKEGTPLPIIWLFYETKFRFDHYLSTFNWEWLESLRGLTLYKDALLDRYAMFDASVTDPTRATLKSPIEYLCNHKFE